jgi:ABC-type transporter lipoprotein component MlaA
LPEQDLRIASNGLETINDWPPTMDLYFNLTAEAFDPYSSIKDGYAQIRANKVSQ